MRLQGVFLLIALLILGLCLGPVAAAAVEVYVDRSEWEAAVAPIRTTEDFSSEPLGTHMTPYETGAGIGLETPGFGIDVIIRDGGAVNGTRELLLKDNNQRVFFSILPNRHQLGLGFDWVTGGEVWTLKFLDQEYEFPAGSSGFFGLADPDGQSAGFELTSSAPTQDGIALDDFTFSSALLVFRDYASWEAALGLAPTVEGFEVETPGSFQTPYTTGGQCTLEGAVSVVDFDVIDSGLIDGSRELHLSDPGTQLTIDFPGSEGQRGFGFEWKATFESWTLSVREESIGLSGMSEGFVGIVDQTGATLGFEVKVLGIVQEGLHLDNLAFAAGTVPVEPLTWGRLKARFR